MGADSHPYIETAPLFGGTGTWSLGSDAPFVIDGVEFVLAYGPTSTSTRFSMIKSPALLDHYRSLRSVFAGGRILELGIAEGGSTAWLALEFAPAKLVAVDLADEPVAALVALIDERGLGTSVRPHWSVDQSDRDHLNRLVDDEFGDELLDVVIDDASHLLDPTRSSFETLFPRLRPGGLFIIEDWNWEHRNTAMWAAYFHDTTAPDHEERQRVLQAQLQDPANWLANMAPLSRLTLELVVACAYSGDIVADVAVNDLWTVVRRGPAPLDPATFSLDHLTIDHFGLVNSPLPPGAASG